MTALSDLLAIPIDAEERTVLADLRQRYSGDRFDRETVAYLTGAVQRVAPRVRAEKPAPAAESFAVALDTHDFLQCSYLTGWLADWRRYDPELQRLPAIDVRATAPGEEPATYRVGAGARIPVDAPQWLRNVMRRAVDGLAEFEGEWASATPQEREACMAAGAECARRFREREGVS